VHRARAHQLQRPGDCVGQSGGYAGENDDRDAVAQAALGDLLAKPHQEHGSRHQRGHRGGAEHQARIEHQPCLALQRDRNAGSLKQRQQQGAVAGVLRDLAPARLAFLAQLVELRADRGHQLHDDRGRDVGHDPEGENGEARQRAARKHVEHAQDPALLALEQVGQHVRVDARHRDVGADAEYDQCPEQEQQPPLQVAVASRLAALGSVVAKSDYSFAWTGPAGGGNSDLTTGRLDSPHARPWSP